PANGGFRSGARRGGKGLTVGIAGWNACMDMFGAKQKKGNRRFRRRHVLDVKLSSQQRRQTRLRRTLLVFTVLPSLFSGLLIAWRGGEWLLRRFVYDNPAFAI